MWVWLNDGLVPEERACVSVFDRGFMYGDGVFETMRSWNGRVFRLDSHLKRLRASAGAIGIPLPRSPEGIAADIATLLERNDLEEAIVRVRISRGKGVLGTASSSRPTYVVSAEPPPEDIEAHVRSGIRLATARVRKTPDAAVPANAKHANYLNSILALAQATAEGADDAVMLTVEGVVAEASRANLFLIKEKTLWTPPLEVGILPGITRAVVLELAPDAGLLPMEAVLALDTLETAEEVFVTNSVAGIVPVRQWDGTAYASPGPGTKKLMEFYDACVAEEVSRA